MLSQRATSRESSMCTSELHPISLSGYLIALRGAYRNSHDVALYQAISSNHVAHSALRRLLHDASCLQSIRAHVFRRHTKRPDSQRIYDAIVDSVFHRSGYPPRFALLDAHHPLMANGSGWDHFRPMSTDVRDQLHGRQRNEVPHLQGEHGNSRGSVNLPHLRSVIPPGTLTARQDPRGDPRPSFALDRRYDFASTDLSSARNNASSHPDDQTLRSSNFPPITQEYTDFPEEAPLPHQRAGNVHNYAEGTSSVNAPTPHEQFYYLLPSFTPSEAGVGSNYQGIKSVPGRGTYHIYEGGLCIPTHVDGEPVNPAWGLTKANRPRKRLSVACAACQEKKVRCEPGIDGCIRCHRRGQPCKAYVNASISNDPITRLLTRVFPATIRRSDQGSQNGNSA